VAERRRNPTSTSNFGVGRRESHDASAFYGRFEAPDLSDDSHVLAPVPVDAPVVCGDSRAMPHVADGSVALVVTSPPYFAGKTYEEELEQQGVPSSYREYLNLLCDVFSECKRKLEPGGRIAVNVANLGRKPYRSLSADVIDILQNELGLLLRGEVIWQKGDGASGSCAWGSYRSAANPVIRDITERVVIASKGRFNRAMSPREREQFGLPYQNTLTADEFMAATLDVWEIPPESAKRVGHPAPFPVALPQRLIELLTYRGDLVLDPFLGSGSTLVAAARTGRRGIGYDMDPEFCRISLERFQSEVGSGTQDPVAASPSPTGVRVPTAPSEHVDDDFQARATREGKAAQALAEQLLTEAGFTIRHRNHRIPKTGVTMNLIADDSLGESWYFDVTGAFTTTRGGLLRSDTVWKCLGRAHVLSRKGLGPLVFLTSHLPKRGGEGDKALRAAGPYAFFDAIEMLSSDGLHRLKSYAASGRPPTALPGFWSPRELNDEDVHA
jgi:DNA modification methylase